MQTLHMMNIFCLSLVQSFLFIKKQTIKNDNNIVYMMIDDRQHLRTQLLNNDFKLHEKFSINNEVKFMEFFSQHLFL